MKTRRARKTQNGGPLRLRSCQALPPSPPRPRCATSALPTFVPTSASTIASTASRAMASTSASACVLTLAISASAAPSLPFSSALDAGAVGGDLGLRRVARLLRDRMRVLARFGERLLVRRDGGVGGFLQPRRLRQIAGDALVALLQDRADPRQRHAAHQDVEQPEEDHEPEELRSEGRRVEGRKRVVLRRHAPRSPCHATVGGAPCSAARLGRRLGLREGR